MPKKEVMLKPCSLAYSNVMLIDPSTDKPTKVARRFLEDGTKVQLENYNHANLFYHVYANCLSAAVA
jgi:hypothetical protein